MKYAALSLFLLVWSFTSAQAVFSKRLTWGTNVLQEARKIIRTPDNSYLVVGYVAADANSLNRDGLVFKINATGTVAWAKKYGGTNFEEFYDVVQVGNYYYCVGYTRSFVNGTFGAPNNLIADIFLVKIKLDGTVVWAKNMGKPVNGTSATDGNDLGFRLVPSGQGGVVIVARINSGAGTNQNNGIIWVDGNGKTRWANQYDLPANISNNELTYSIWKDGPESYITGGWVQTFSAPTFTGGLLFKINQNGNIVWDRNVRCTPGVFESLYYGYYNHNTGKIYSTDYYSESNGAIREVEVCTNLAATGNAPAPGVIPQVKRFHYGAAGSAQNNYRSLIFPVGDGYERFLLATNDLTAPSANNTIYSTLISLDKDLNFQWAKKVGATHTAGGLGYANQVFDVIPCDGANQSLLAVGTITKSNNNKEVLFARFGGTGTLANCEVTSGINNSNLGETATAINLTKVNLNTAGCGTNCWADDDLIGSITVTDIATTVSSGDCLPAPGAPEEVAAKFDEINNIIPILNINPSGPVTPSSTPDLTFSFLKVPKEVYFEITDPTGTFVYERFFGGMDKLTAGFRFGMLDVKSKEYTWEIQAVYDDETGIERKTGQFKVQ